MIFTHHIVCPSCEEQVEIEGHWHLDGDDPSVGYYGQTTLEECDQCPKCNADVFPIIEHRVQEVLDDIEDRKAEAQLANREDD